jgi:hypothetical protein
MEQYSTSTIEDLSQKEKAKEIFSVLEEHWYKAQLDGFWSGYSYYFEYNRTIYVKFCPSDSFQTQRFSEVNINPKEVAEGCIMFTVNEFNAYGTPGKKLNHFFITPEGKAIEVLHGKLSRADLSDDEKFLLQDSWQRVSTLSRIPQEIINNFDSFLEFQRVIGFKNIKKFVYADQNPVYPHYMIFSAMYGLQGFVDALQKGKIDKINSYHRQLVVTLDINMRVLQNFLQKIGVSSEEERVALVDAPLLELADFVSEFSTIEEAEFFELPSYPTDKEFQILSELPYEVVVIKNKIGKTFIMKGNASGDKVLLLRDLLLKLQPVTISHTHPTSSIEIPFKIRCHEDKKREYLIFRTSLPSPEDLVSHISEVEENYIYNRFGKVIFNTIEDTYAKNQIDGLLSHIRGKMTKAERQEVKGSAVKLINFLGTRMGEILGCCFRFTPYDE